MPKMGWWTGGGVALLMLSMGAQAQTARAVRQTVEASMLVSGEIEISPQGQVRNFSVAGREDLPPEVTGLLDQLIPAWRFEPVEREGHAVAARSPMRLRLVARKLGEDRYGLSVVSAQFDGEPEPGERVQSRDMKPPSYPMAAAQSGVGGDVYVLVRVGRDGQVEDVAAEQTNLRVVDSAPRMDKWRRILEQAALSGARHWSFTPPTRGDTVDDAYWQVRVPVSFSVGEDLPSKGENHWRAYVPGPRQPVPWATPDMAADAGVDAGAAGQPSQVGVGLHLRSPLGAS